MRYSTELKYRKYIKGYGFSPFAKKIGDKYGEKINRYCKKARIDAAKTASKRVVQKTAETTGDLTGIKIADKIISVGKTKSNKKEDRQEIYILHKKDSKLLLT